MPPHIKKHGINTEQYKAKFPGKKVICEKSAIADSNSLRGKLPWNKGLTKETDERVKKMADSITDWNFYYTNGCKRQFYPYDNSFTEKFRTKIRNLYDNKCVVTGITNEEHKKLFNCSLDVHHWMYDKDETNPFYFVPVAHGIHTKTNFNRSQWIDMFNGIAEEKWCEIIKNEKGGEKTYDRAWSF